MEEEIKNIIYEFITDILKTYAFPTDSQLYEETMNEFINRLCIEHSHIKEQLLIEKDKNYNNLNQLIVGCIYVIARDMGGNNLKTADITRSIQKVNHVLEQMNLIINNNEVSKQI